MHRYLKLFLLAVILMSGIQVVLSGKIAAGIIIGTFLGFVFTIIMIITDKLGARKLKNKASSDPIQKAEIAVDGIKNLFDICVQSCKNFPATILEQNVEAGVIKARTGMSWHSFGEILEVKLIKSKNHLSTITISSKPKIKGTLIDHGKGAKNVEKITTLIKAMVEKEKASLSPLIKF